MDFNQLFQQALKGDKNAEKQLFQHLSARFGTFTRFKISNRDDCEEVVQEAIMTVFKKYHQLDVGANFRAWCLKVLSFQIKRYYTGKWARSNKMTDIDLVEHYHKTWQPDFEFRERLLTCLEQVHQRNRRYAKIINLHYRGYTTEEICAEMNLTANNYYVTLLRARSILAACLEKEEND